MPTVDKRITELTEASSVDLTMDYLAIDNVRDGTRKCKPLDIGAKYSLEQDQTDGHILHFTGTDGTDVDITTVDTNTTYSPFTGTDGVESGTSGLVPAPTTSDTNKYLKSDGTWASVGGGTAVVDLTQADYNALSTAQKKNGSVYMTHDGGYDFISYNDGDIIVRVNNSTQETLWFFRGWNKTTTADVDIPEELAEYAPSVTTPVFSANYPNGGTTQDGWIGFYLNKIRAWNQVLGGTIAGVMYGVVNIAGGANQMNAFTQPTDGLTLEPNRIYHMDDLYSEVVDGDAIWNEINGINNSLTDLIKVEAYRCVYSINANTGLHLSPTDFGITTPIGYTPLAICRFNSGREDIYARNVNIDPTSSAVMSVYNTSNANRTNVYAYMAIAYIKSDFVAVSS